MPDMQTKHTKNNIRRPKQQRPRHIRMHKQKMRGDTIMKPEYLIWYIEVLNQEYKGNTSMFKWTAKQQKVIL